MENFRKETRRHCSLLHVFECPISLIRAAVELCEGDATVENLRPNSALNWFSLKMQLFPGNDLAVRTVRSVSLDVSLSRQDFLDLLPYWDRNGVYAVFSTAGPIKFRASDLEADARYMALKNLTGRSSLQFRMALELTGGT